LKQLIIGVKSWNNKILIGRIIAHSVIISKKNTSVCSKLHFSLDSNPKTFIKKCAGQFYELDKDKKITLIENKIEHDEKGEFSKIGGNQELQEYVLKARGLSRKGLNIMCFIGVFIFGWLLAVVFEMLGKKKQGRFYIIPIIGCLVI
jgi:hypothetical protein